MAEEFNGSRCGRNQVQDHTHGGTFAGSVGSQETQNVPPSDFEIEILDCLELSEAFAQTGSAHNHICLFGPGRAILS
jgi:hypothetical protein